ncbi:MAG: transporter substrate-binding domain-containing protein [Aliifodinibius sp.]|nr:transporter substrate-binding domain-containing protein [Fodinibius sp.]
MKNSRKFYFILGILTLFALVLSACGGTQAENTGNTPAEEEPAAEEPAADTGESILARVRDRGRLVCGARTDLTGFGYLNADGENIGFDVDLCRAVAAAVLGDANAVEFVPLTAADRGPALQTAEVDMLSRNVTWTSSRDAQWGNFTIVMFYDGQTFMTRVDSGIEGPDDFDGATVCVTSGTTTEANLNQYFSDNGWEYEAVIFEETAAVYGAYESGRCDLTTSDQSQLFSVRSGFENPDDHLIFDFYISKEPLTPAVPHGDDAWFDIVKVVMYALINAEELGVTQGNVGSMGDSSDGRIRTLVGTGDDWGYGQYGLDADALARAIGAVGNYGELYARYFGENGMAFFMERGLNDNYTNGGVIYAPPIK